MKALKLEIPNQDEEVLAQGRVPKELKELVEGQFLKDRELGEKMNWKKLITMACESYLKQRKKT